MGAIVVNIDRRATREAGKGNTNIDTGERDLFSVLGDDKRSRGARVIQHSSELNDLQILIANILDGGDDHDFGGRRNLVGRSRERDLKATESVSGGLSVSIDSRETKSKERQRVHGDAKECGAVADELRFDVHRTPTPDPLYAS